MPSAAASSGDVADGVGDAGRVDDAGRPDPFRITVAALQGHLRRRGLRPKGRKADLQDQLVAAHAEDDREAATAAALADAQRNERERAIAAARASGAQEPGRDQAPGAARTEEPGPVSGGTGWPVWLPRIGGGATSLGSSGGHATGGPRGATLDGALGATGAGGGHGQPTGPGPPGSGGPGAARHGATTAGLTGATRVDGLGAAGPGPAATAGAAPPSTMDATRRAILRAATSGSDADLVAAIAALRGQGASQAGPSVRFSLPGGGGTTGGGGGANTAPAPGSSPGSAGATTPAATAARGPSLFGPTGPPGLSTARGPALRGGGGATTGGGASTFAGALPGAAATASFLAGGLAGNAGAAMPAATGGSAGAAAGSAFAMPPLPPPWGGPGGATSGFTGAAVGGTAPAVPPRGGPGPGVGTTGGFAGATAGGPGPGVGATGGSSGPTAPAPPTWTGGTGPATGAPPALGGPGLHTTPPHWHHTFGLGLGHSAATPTAAVAPAADLPPPEEWCGALGWACHVHGPTDAPSALTALRRMYDSVASGGHDPVRWRNAVLAASRPAVLLSVDPRAPRTMLVYGLQRHSSHGGPPSGLDGALFAFLGDGSQQVRDCLHVVPPSTEAALGTVVTLPVATRAAAEAFYATQQGLLPPAAGLPLAAQELVVAPLVAELPHGLVHVFGDEPHPHVALMRVEAIESTMPPGAGGQAFTLVKALLRAACHQRPADGRSTFALDWMAPMLRGEENVLAWAKDRHDAIVPPRPATAPAAAGVTEERAAEIARAEASKQRQDKEAPKGCRRMGDADFHRHLLYCGVDPATATREDGNEWVQVWQSTPNNENQFRTAIVTAVKRSAALLGFPNRVRCCQAYFVNGTRWNELGFSLDTSFERSHLGLTIAGTWALCASFSEAAEWTQFDLAMAGATHVTPEDRQRALGKPCHAPQGLRELIDSLECYIVHLHAFITLDGEHQTNVRQIHKMLKNDCLGQLASPLQQERVNDIYWRVFRDGRHWTGQATTRRVSLLRGLVNELASMTMSLSLDVPHASLSPTRAGRKRPAEDGAPPPPAAKVKTEEAAHGTVTHCHPSVKAAFEEVVRANDNKHPRLTAFVTAAKKTGGGTWNLKSLGLRLNNKCATGMITGRCTKKECNFVHTHKLSAAEADLVCGVLRSAASGGATPAPP